MDTKTAKALYNGIVASLSEMGYEITEEFDKEYFEKDEPVIFFEKDEPVLFEDEIAEILDNCGAGAEVLIHDNTESSAVYRFSGTYDLKLVNKIYNALEAGIPVTVNGTNITEL